MNQDQQTFGRGLQAAMAGLLIQVILTVFVYLLGLWSESVAVSAAFWHFLGGVAIWFVLVLVYNQHRIERAESLEAERLARSDATAAALFDEAADDLDLARRRLGTLYKWGLTITSLVTALYLLIAGGVLFFLRNQMLGSGDLGGATVPEQVELNARLLAGFMFVVGFAAFVAARYVAGMTRVNEWQLLRGGASYLMGNVLVSALIAAGAVLVFMGFSEPMKYLALVVPGLMMLIGLEMALTLLLSVYRPRRPGEVPRPAFDSRALGVLTSPESLGKIVSEAINYQLGVDISQSWFYQLLARSLTKLIAAGVVALLLMSCVVIVAPHQKAVITHFGAKVGIAESGLSFKLPYPLGQAEKFDVGRVLSVRVGSIKARGGDVAILWTNQHTEGEEQYMVTGPTVISEAASAWTGSDGVSDDAEDVAAGMSLVAAELGVMYRITDLHKYVLAAEDPKAVVEAVSDEALNQYFVAHSIDTLLSEGRQTAGEQLKGEIQRRVDALDLGVEIVFAGLLGIHPPQKEEVAAAFQDVIAAQQERQTEIQKAEKEAVKVLTEVAGTYEQGLQISEAIQQLRELRGQAGAEGGEAEEQAEEKAAQIELLLAQAQGEAAEKIFEARAYRWQRAVTERAKAERFAAELMAYRAAPNVYRQRAYLGALADSLSQPRKVVISPENVKTPTVRLDLKDTQSTFDELLAEED